jgi:hypothetical protein
MSSHRNNVSHQVCPPATKDDILNFQHAMGVCFKAAVDAGLSIAVSPRLDDGWEAIACCHVGTLRRRQTLMWPWTEASRCQHHAATLPAAR